MHEEGLAYNTVNAYRSTLSTIHPHIEGTPVGQLPDITKLLEGMYNVRPPTPRYTNTWDVSKVLDYIKDMGANANLSLRELNLKLTTLIALTTACRASEIQNINPQTVTDHGHSLVFQLEKPTKVSKHGTPLPQITLHAYTVRERDPVECYRAYLHCTQHLRTQNKQASQLLLSSVKPHGPIATHTISNWLKQMLEKAGIDTKEYKGHSFRAAATSKANKAGLPIQDIIDKANWSRANTFHKHYNRHITSNPAKFASTVLDS